MDFKENDLINEVLINYYNTFQIMIDTPDFVPPKINNYIASYLYKRMKKKFKEAKKIYKQNLKLEKKQLKLLEKQELLKKQEKKKLKNKREKEKLKKKDDKKIIK